MSILGGLESLGSGIYDAGKSTLGTLASPFTGSNKVQGPPGAVQGPQGAQMYVAPFGTPVDQNGQPLQRDPVTGNYYAPSTGTSFAAHGAAITDPTLAQQVAQHSQPAQTYQTQGNAQNTNLEAAQKNQGQRVQTLQNVVAGRAPSVAATQLAQSQDQTERNILGQVAGVGGPSAYDARRAAISAIANSRLQNAGQAAQLRAQEIQGATGQLATAINNQAGTAQARQNANVQAGAT